MTRVITQQDLRDDTESILDAVADGDSFVITHNEVPVAELRPIGRPVFVDKEKLRHGAPLPPIDGIELRSELDELFDQEPFRDI